MTRGLRNHNPGNIERNNTRWQGMSEDQTGDSRFIVFKHPKWGIRTIARILITYQDHRAARDGSKIDTVREFIERWAPSFENPTEEYAQYVRNMIQLSKGDTIDVHNYEVMNKMVRAIIHFENGEQPYDDATIDQGLRLAGIDVPAKPVTKSRTMKAGTVATVTTSIGAMSETLTNAIDALQPLTAYSSHIETVLVVLTVASVGVMMWSRMDDANKESRPWK